MVHGPADLAGDCLAVEARCGDVDHRLESVPTSALDALILSPPTQPLSIYAPVLALTITRTTGAGREVLITVRDGSTNITHPDVLSSPTMRLPDLASAAELGNVASSSWLREEVAVLMTKKLDVPYADTSDCVIDRVAAWQGESVIGRYADGSLATELLTMINVHVNATGSAIDFAPQTAEYRAIRWIAEQDHAEMVRRRSVSGIDLDLTGPPPIVYGLCTESTARMLAQTSATRVK